MLRGLLGAAAATAGQRFVVAPAQVSLARGVDEPPVWASKDAAEASKDARGDLGVAVRGLGRPVETAGASPSPLGADWRCPAPLEALKRAGGCATHVGWHDAAPGIWRAASPPLQMDQQSIAMADPTAAIPTTQSDSTICCLTKCGDLEQLHPLQRVVGGWTGDQEQASTGVDTAINYVD